jgi:outer membrane protein assembly factor BamB
LDAATGVVRTNFGFEAGNDTFNSPSFYDDAMYFTEGSTVFRSGLAPGGVGWFSRAPFGLGYDQTPAIDANYVYHALGTGILMLNRADGASVATIFSRSTSGGGGTIAPVLALGYVLTADTADNNRLIAVDPAARAVAWRGPWVGTAQPVAAGSTIYSWAAGAAVSQVSAINAATGETLWSWLIPAGETRLTQNENMVVTDTHLILSTNRSIHAIDLATHQTVWTYPAHGTLALSANLVLYVLESDHGVTPSKLTAFRLGG